MLKNGIDIAAIHAIITHPIQLIMKSRTLLYFFILATIIFISCNKQDVLTPLPVTEPSYISFSQDTVPVSFSITQARKETIGSLLVTAIDGKKPDSIFNKSNLIIRVTGDSARLYTNTEIFASYTDSLGNSFANDISDTINTVKFTKLKKIKDGIAAGSFTIRVSNLTKTKILLLNNGKFSTSMIE